MQATRLSRRDRQMQGVEMRYRDAYSGSCPSPPTPSAAHTLNPADRSTASSPGAIRPPRAWPA